LGRVKDKSVETDKIDCAALTTKCWALKPKKSSVHVHKFSDNILYMLTERLSSRMPENTIPLSV